MIETSKTEKEREKRLSKTKQNRTGWTIQEQQDDYQYKVRNVCNGNTRGEEREKGTEEIFEAIMTENFPKLMSNIKLQMQEAQRIPSRINPLSPIIFKLQNIKDKEKHPERSWGVGGTPHL